MMNLLWFLSGHHHGSHEGASSHGRLALGFGAGPLLCMAHMEGPMDIWVIAGGESFSIEDATEDADGFQLTGIDGRRLYSLTCGPQVPESPCFAGYPHYQQSSDSSPRLFTTSEVAGYPAAALVAAQEAGLEAAFNRHRLPGAETGRLTGARAAGGRAAAGA